MDNTSFQDKLRDILRAIETLPAEKQAPLKDLAKKTEATHKELAATAKGLAETLDNLRLQIKYLVFDLEATRRENSYLRKMLEKRQRNDFDDDQGDF